MSTDALYRQPYFNPDDTLFVRCLQFCTVVALALVIGVQFMPAAPPKPVVKLEELPQRFAKLILEPAKKVPPPPA